MIKFHIRQIPAHVWVISILLLSLSLYFELFSNTPRTGTFWVINLISVTLFSYHLGLVGGIAVLLLILGVRIGVDFQTFSSLSTTYIIRALIVNSIGFITSISIGYLAGKLRSKERKIREIFSNNDITFWTRDLITGKVTVSEGNAEVYGVSRKEFEKKPDLWKEQIHPEDLPILLNAIDKQMTGEKTSIVYRIHRADGEIRWVEDRGTPVFNKKGVLTKIDGVIFDVTTSKIAKDQMNKMAYRDSLTDLPNRNWFQNYLQTALEKHSTLAVMFIDFDNFKRINDTFGHRAGDFLLRQIANRLQSCLREGDIVSRLGGDEFLVLVENAEVNEVIEIAERIIREMNDPYTVEGTEILATPSIGISLAPESGNDAESLIEMADFAMYLAKKRGKNNYQFYNDELNKQMKRRTLLETRLHKAIENEELEVYYQPQIRLNTGCLAGAEALLRWECDLGKISPEEFIPIAEDNGLIIPIGEWVLREACKHLKRFNKNGMNGFPISVNLSTKQLMHPTIVDRIKEILFEEDVKPQMITLEITESALLFYEDAKQNITELRCLGVGISLDDFGVGFSSLSMIKNIEVDELKIDKSFLNDALENKRVRSLLETIIQIGKNLEAKVVIEGVETAVEMEFLMKQQVYGQGYFYSRPLTVGKFEQWYNAFYRKEKENRLIEK
ncbi:putative bifunctional diguanylate cyclase/phosphodiesterase [Virgibacillus kekensis]|uniref:Bifunctional diguanylate cyclase/phosphodiesterase n=1 Tax=Virgibacillus kekensis TaxID=202261 RepID=A0ABV9DJE4_9BACI